MRFCCRYANELVIRGRRTTNLSNEMDLMIEMKRGKKEQANRGSAKFLVTDYPFYFMHTIIVRNNQNIADAIRDRGLTPHIWRILAILQEKDGLTVSELADASSIDRTLLSRILADLEARKFVVRRSRPDDKRYSGVFIAQAGQRAFAELLPRAKQEIDRGIAGLSEQELDQLMSLLKRVLSNLNQPE